MPLLQNKVVACIIILINGNYSSPNELEISPRFLILNNNTSEKQHFISCDEALIGNNLLGSFNYLEM